MAEREPAPGDVLGGRYEILAELGRGGMATVYRSRDLRLQRRVAVKVFRAGFARSVDPHRRTQEMQLLASVNHPAVVGVLDASTGDGVFGAYLVMELVAGEDLGALLHRARGPLSADFARRIVADVAAALQALHERGIVHRDVKPANILVPTDAAHRSSEVAAKLTDFGIAKLVDAAAVTAPETVLGTAAYLSPEQMRGAPPRPASDVYSLGLVLLEALTGQRAFPGAAAEAAMARLHRPPELPGDASPALADLLSRMTAMDAAHRPTAAEVATALRGQLVGRVTAPDAATTVATPIAGIAAPPLPAPHEPVRTPGRGMPVTGAGGRPAAPLRRRFPAVLAVAASVLAAAVAGVVISAAAGTQAPRTPPSPAASRAASPAPSDPVSSAPGGRERDLVVKREPDPRPASSRPAPSPGVSTPAPASSATVSAPSASPPAPVSTPRAAPSASPSAEAPEPSAPASPAPPAEPTDAASAPAASPPAASAPTDTADPL